mmetsp:Transcript_2891/g.9805  ORF Transcript_2891/g.9805 Transcript_2891/m.9805 type:complete len:234 (+) Transcript_2891:120-821(+)
MGNGQSRRNREQRNAAHAQQGGAYNPHGGFHAPQAFQPPPGQMQYYGQTQFQGQNQFYGQFPPPPQHYPQQMPPAPAPETQRTQTIRNDVNLKKGTLQLVQSPTDPDLYYATFLFDAAKPCSVSVFFGVTEESSEKCMLRAGKVPFGPRLFYSKSGKDGVRARLPTWSPASPPPPATPHSIIPPYLHPLHAGEIGSRRAELLEPHQGPCGCARAAGADARAGGALWDPQEPAD